MRDRHGCFLLCLCGEVGGAWDLGHKDLDSGLAFPTDGLCGLGQVVCPPQASASFAYGIQTTKSHLAHETYSVDGGHYFYYGSR